MNRQLFSLKTSPELAELRQQHSDVRPSRHLNKAHWSACSRRFAARFANLLSGGCVLSAGGEFTAEEKRKLLVQL